MRDGPRPSRRTLISFGRRPAVPAAGLFIAGILAHNALPARPGLWLAVMAVLLALACPLLRRPIVCSFLLALATLLGGLTAAQLYASYYPRDHVSAYAADDPRLAQLEL